MKYLPIVLGCFFASALNAQLSYTIDSSETEIKYRKVETKPATQEFVLNDLADEMFYFISESGKEYYCSNKPPKNKNITKVDDRELYYYRIYENQQGEMKPFLLEKRTENYHYGPFYYNEGMKELAVTVSGERWKKDFNTVRIEFVDIDNPGKTIPFTHNSEKYAVGHPFMSADGNTLYFSSNMPGGQGGTDLWKCDRTGDGWSAPMNLGNEINSPQNEYYPYLTKEGDLIFTSDRTGGLGGKDLYLALMLDGKLNSPVNLGEQINSSVDDYGFALSSDMKKAYVTSARPTNHEGENIFELTFEAPFIRTEIEEIPLPAEDAVDFVDEVVPAVKKFEYFFGLNSASLTTDQKALIKEQLEGITDFKKMTISGFADPTGSAKVNKKISKKRAQSVASYVKSLGFKSTKIEIQSFGSERLDYSSDDKNRRVDIEVEL